LDAPQRILTVYGERPIQNSKHSDLDLSG